MSNEELVRLIRINENSSENLGHLYEKNKGIIYKIALRYKIENGCLDMDDLMQEGYLGLYEAAMHYDVDREVKFITYAVYWIRQSMYRYLENNRYSIHVSAAVQTLYNQYRNVMGNFPKVFGRMPTNKEIEKILECNQDTLDKIQNYAVNVVKSRSLDETFGEDEKMVLADTVQGSCGIEDNIIDRILDRERKSGLWLVVEENTTDNESNVIFNRYHENKTLEETGKVIGVTRERVRALESQALRKLRCDRVKNILRARFYAEEMEGNTYRLSTERAAYMRYNLGRFR